jgi:hypothetical protein
MAKPSTSLRFSAVLLAVFVALPAVAMLAAPARAQTGTGGTTGTTDTNALAKEDFQFRFLRPGSKANEWVYMSDTDVKFYFNRARCDCKSPVRLQVDLTAGGQNKLRARTITSGELKIKVGTLCAARQPSIGMICTDIAKLENIGELVNGPLNADTTVDVLFNTVASGTDGGVGADCTRRGSQTFTVFLDNNIDQIPDLADDLAPTVGITFDGEAPPVPRITELLSGNEALQVSWASVGDIVDFQGYIVFCARGADIPVFPGHFKPGYDTAQGLCPGGPTPVANAFQVADADGGADDAGTGGAADADDGTDAGGTSSTPGTPAVRGVATAPFRTLDPRYACSDMLTTGTKRRLYQLQNGIPYLVGVAAVDDYGNTSPMEVVWQASPVPTRDFYRAYRDRGGADDGGYCSLARTRAGAGLPWMGGAVAAAALALVVRRLRRRR